MHTVIVKKKMVLTKGKYFVNITRSRKKICLTLYNNETNRVLYANGVKNHYFKAKDSQIKPYSLCLENISKDLTVSNGKICNFSLSYEAIDVNDIESIHRC